jgi:hypothetical protein
MTAGAKGKGKGKRRKPAPKRSKPREAQPVARIRPLPRRRLAADDDANADHRAWMDW